MKKLLKMVAIAGAVFAFSGSELWAITVTNGGFEDPGLVTGWNTVDNGDMLLISGATPYGSQHLEIGGFGGGVQNSIDQLVGGFTPTLTYRVTFSIASQWANQDGSSGRRLRFHSRLDPRRVHKCSQLQPWLIGLAGKRTLMTL